MFGFLNKAEKRSPLTDSAPEPVSPAVVAGRHVDLIHEFAEDAEIKMMALLKEEGALTHGFNELLGGTEFTLNEIRQVEDHLLELAANSRDTQGFVEAVFESLNESQRVIQDTREGHEDMAVQMEAVAELFSQFYGLFNQLSIQYGEIQKFANMITNIANQTRLLSLNASIEAARVGAAGVGFAVVADEIKKLSDESQKNASDIIGSLNLMTETIGQLNEKSSSGGKVVLDTKELVKRSEIQMSEVVDVEERIRTGILAVRDSQASNLEGISKITANLSNVAAKSDRDNQQLQNLVGSIQKKSAYYSYILNHLNQIGILRKA